MSEEAITLDLVRYHQAVAGPLLATIGGRPVLLERYPSGAGGKSSALNQAQPETRAQIRPALG